MKWVVAAGLLAWAGGTATVLAFFVGRGKLINEWRDHCAQFARQQQAEHVRRAHEDAEHSERLWAELNQSQHHEGL